MGDLRGRVAEVRARIERAARQADREPAAVGLVAVSKTFAVARVLDAVAAGVRALGENRIQEAAAKIPAVSAACDARLEWHMVGGLQRNKARRAVELFDVIHSVDRVELAEALERAAEQAERRPRVLLQVDLDDEPQKGGVSPDQAPALASAVAALPHLELSGLMAIPRPQSSPELQRPAFARLRSLLEELKLTDAGLCQLSMGMSADFEVAIAEGATWVRVGTAIFGERDRP